MSRHPIPDPCLTTQQLYFIPISYTYFYENFGDTILNSTDYVASSTTSRDMYDVLLIAALFKWVISWLLVQLLWAVENVRFVNLFCPILWFDFLYSY